MSLEIHLEQDSKEGKEFKQVVGVGVPGKVARELKIRGTAMYAHDMKEMAYQMHSSYVNG